MGLTHDGLQTPLQPSRLWQAVGLLLVLGGVGLIVQGWYCTAIGVLVFGLLTVGNQLSGITRVRITFSKLLVEDERPVMGFLIGPSKRRIPWAEFQGVEVAGGKVVAKGKATTLELGDGCPEPELAELARKIQDAAERYAREGGED
jgi:hypothetical protein